MALGTALTGSLVMALVSPFGPLPARLAVLGLFLSFLAQDERHERQHNEGSAQAEELFRRLFGKAG